MANITTANAKYSSILLLDITESVCGGLVSISVDNVS